MSPPLEHDYFAVSPSMAARNDQKAPLINLKETELRLGLPGSQSPERAKLPNLAAVSIFGKELMKNAVSGAKRGFSDAIDGSWVIFSNPEGDSVKPPALLSPRGGAGAKGAVDSSNGDFEGLMKDAAPEKKTQLLEHAAAPASKAQVVGWPPIRSFRKNSMASNLAKNGDGTEAKSGPGCLFVKVSLDGAPYLRKIDLKNYTNYAQLSTALEKLFTCFTIGQCGTSGLSGLSENCLKDILHGSEFVLTYEDKDGDWMLVGDVPWEMFTNSCRRLRIMKSSEAIGLAPRAVEKSKNRD